MKASYPDHCGRCDRPINVGDDIVTTRREQYVHRGCASGQDDQ